MMILAFMGSDLPAQNSLIALMERAIKPDYRLHKITFSSRKEGASLNTIRTATAAGAGPELLTVFTGIVREEEIALLRARGAFFCVLPGVLPRVLLSGRVGIDDQFIFVTSSPGKCGTEAKRKMYCTPEEAFSRCLVAEMRRNGRLRHAAAC
ncbi:hypothetical protein F3I27_21820 [Pantoea sp. Bo_2]|uniref:Uncharacterized protein n=2 Tax=Pantoea TaxID=53335 RepID=A0AB34CEF7_9GAMM|nr:MULTISPECIES: hypothetical protein [Pantoea]KAA5937577.1 hypothetical protein F3I57_21295 [Pantoea sp. VH_3]KAA5946708.1 hypothetical protein F3I56_22080 [Pantoea sp. VH_25]KAA5949528.1 hypothetical protein F3I55_22435 [Pantoea sp. VH_24]KAA5957725.1 hypothetical protein F3I53_15860 [Pantoea sp. VH_16]KAA5959142.1 hypothetical protein F3I54_22465 [Pantoea sp. VH_18]